MRRIRHTVGVGYVEKGHTIRVTSRRLKKTCRFGWCWSHRLRSRDLRITQPVRPIMPTANTRYERRRLMLNRMSSDQSVGLSAPGLEADMADFSSTYGKFRTPGRTPRPPGTGDTAGKRSELPLESSMRHGE